MMRNEKDMTEYEKMIKFCNENLDKYRIAGDIDAFKTVKKIKKMILKKMGEEVAREYEELFGI
jgi:hypothetical protein|tara:strand:+ start:264 stop:452 length:189 start_codon:yes stop_codon:yes gene_type:complete